MKRGQRPPRSVPPVPFLTGAADSGRTNTEPGSSHTILFVWLPAAAFNRRSGSQTGSRDGGLWMKVRQWTGIIHADPIASPKSQEMQHLAELFGAA